MPIHVRAEQGEYAEACLLPGDPLRAKYIAETYLDDVVQRNSERGLLGYTGTWEGKPVSVQGTGMGCPGATIIFEELVQLGVKKLLRVGTCGGLQPHHELGDMIVAPGHPIPVPCTEIGFPSQVPVYPSRPRSEFRSTTSSKYVSAMYFARRGSPGRRHASA